MIRRWRLAGTLLPLLLALLAGCEPVTEPAAEPASVPEVARQVLGAAESGHGGTVLDAAGNEYTLVRGGVPPLLSSRYLSSLIDDAGGLLSLAGHTLSIPAGAVSEPTVFLMVLLPGGHVQVELLALEWTLFGLADVGAQGFGEPVSLSLSYAYAQNVDDPSRLRILHLREDGTAEPLPTTLDPAGQTVTAELEHFSKYCMAMD